MNLAEGNIGFKRGEGSKKMLDIGMITPRLMDDTINELNKSGIETRNCSSSDSKFIIYLSNKSHCSHCKIEYDDDSIFAKFQFRGPNMFRDTHTQTDLLEIVYEYFRDFYTTKILEMNILIEDYQIRREKTSKAIENSSI